MTSLAEQALYTDLLKKDFLSLASVSSEDILKLVKNAQILKAKSNNNITYEPLKGKTLAMIFEKPSTRTRVSFEVGFYQLGGHALYLNSDDMQLGRGEPISDTAKVLSEFVDAIMIRTFGHEIVEELAENASVPIINGLTDKYHPCQALADLVTIYENKGTFKGLKFVYVGDGNNVANSLMIACSKVGMDCVIATPEGFEPEAEVRELAERFSAKSGSEFIITNNVNGAVENADIIYTDVWLSMGDEAGEEKLARFKDFKIDDKLVEKAKDDYIFMHCLPAERGLEVSASVIDGDNSVVFQQAGNRLHAQKAVMLDLMNK